MLYCIACFFFFYQIEQQLVELCQVCISKYVKIYKLMIGLLIKNYLIIESFGVVYKLLFMLLIVLHASFMSLLITTMIQPTL